MDIKEIQKWAEWEDNRLRQRDGEHSGLLWTLAYMTKLTEETGELAEQVLIHNGMARAEKLAKKNQKDLEGEIADVILSAVMVGHSMGVNIEKAVADKLEIIKKRKY